MNKRKNNTFIENEFKFNYFTFLAYLLFAVSPLLVAQQTVSGNITCGSSGEPVAGATVFIANTTISVTSNQLGNYSIAVPIEGSFEIVVSHVGYLPEFHTVEAPDSSHRINWTLEVREISELTITVHGNYRQSDVNFFWRRLLGVNPSRRGLEVLNPEKVHFFRRGDSLMVSCREPIEIINHEMGYLVRYVLNRFHHDYRTDETLISGKPYFEYLTPQDSRQQSQWEKRRQDMYAVSITRFMRSLYRGEANENGFLMIEKDHLHNESFSYRDILQEDEGHVHLRIDSPLYLLCVSRPVTERMTANVNSLLFGWNMPYPAVILLPQQLLIYSDGSYSGALRVEEHRNSTIGLWAMLPMEYGNY